MTSAYILIIAVLVLGGLIAALGDRIGSKVGKARLRLFKLRPKQTAVVITIATGILISSSTLLILFTFSESLRQGIFELDEILRKRREITAQLNTVEQEKEKIENELEQAKQRQDTVENQLKLNVDELYITQGKVRNIEIKSQALTEEVNRIIAEKNSLLQEKSRIQKQTQILEKSILNKDRELNLKDQKLTVKDQELSRTNQELNSKNSELNTKEEQINQQEIILKQQQESLQELKNRQSELESQIQSRDQQISELDNRILESNQILENREKELITLEQQLEFFRKEAETLEQYYQTYQDLRERPIAIVKGQVLTVTLIQTEKNTDTAELIDGILSEANRGVMAILGYGQQTTPDRFVRISKGQVEQIKQQLNKPGQYLVRILSAGNYVQGEEQIRIFADVTPNQKVYASNQTIASILLEPDDLKNNELQEKLDFLISVSQFRARREGILGRIFIGNGNLASLINFIQKLQLSNQPIDEIRTIAGNESYTSGPLQIKLIVLNDGQEVFRF